VVKINVKVFWVVALCSVVISYHNTMQHCHSPVYVLPLVERPGFTPNRTVVKIILLYILVIVYTLIKMRLYSIPWETFSSATSYTQWSESASFAFSKESSNVTDQVRYFVTSCNKNNTIFP